MTERPILFSGAMVRAILSGQKTVTRRAIKHQPDVPVTDAIPRRNYPHGPATVDWYWRPQHGHLNGVPSHGWDFKCPYGQPGDRLWVREAWSIDMLGAHSTDNGYDSMYALRYRADDAEREIHVAPGEPDPYIALYDSQRGDWRPSIHMPRWACRILLEITDVRVERLRDISGDQARAEGIYSNPAMNGMYTADGDLHTSKYDGPVEAFATLWESINGDGSWAANPWVWVVEFKRVTP